MGLLFSLSAVVILLLSVLIGVGEFGMTFLFGVIIPYAALVLFVCGVIYRVLKWASSPVPFRITTTCGQQKSLSWIKPGFLESPHNTIGVIARMALEVLFFRTLFRSAGAELREGPRLTYGGFIWLWFAGLAFHWSFLFILVRHLRFFIEPVPFFMGFFEGIDGLFRIGIPTLFMTDIVILLAATYLFMRRVVIPQIRYISLPADYFPLFLILALGTSGILMRYLIRTDITPVKELAMGLFAFKPVVPDGIGVIFYIHLFTLCVLISYFPFSKLTHMAGIFLSPTRNLANNSRFVRHVNPWNYAVKFHTYAAYEDEFREKMIEVGLPVDKQPEPESAEEENKD